MTVLHVITGLDTGGAERMLGNLCIAGRQAEAAPLVVSLRAGGAQAERLRAAGVRVEDLGMRRGLPGPSSLMRLVRILRREAPAVVQGWMYHADLYALLALWLSGRRRRTRLYWGVRCSDVDLRRYGLSLRVAVRLCALLSRFVDGIVVNSRAGVLAHRRLGYRTGHMTVIDNGFDTETFRPDPAVRDAVRRELALAPDAFVIATVARLDQMKDYPTLLAALERLDGVTCVVIGRGTETLPDRPGLIRLGERQDVARLLNAVDLVVSASAFGEGFSNAIGEAMATGVAVVATDVGDARRIIDGAGVVVPCGAPGALAEAIRALRQDADRRVAMGAAARRRIEEQFSLKRAAEAFEALYANAGAAGKA